jgi:hypothetical protein
MLAQRQPASRQALPGRQSPERGRPSLARKKLPDTGTSGGLAEGIRTQSVLCRNYLIMFNLQALLEAVAKGDETTPAPAPGWVEPSGAVKVPEKWEHLLKNAMREVHRSDAREEAEEELERQQAHQAQQQRRQAAAAAAGDAR